MLLPNLLLRWKPEYISTNFARFIKTGNINRALRLLSGNPDNGVLDLTDEVRRQLQVKHLEIFSKFDTLLLNGQVNGIHKIKLDDRSWEPVEKASIRIKWAAGPLKPDDWQRIIGSNVFGDHSLGLRKSLARMLKKLCSQELQSCESLKLFLVFNKFHKICHQVSDQF